MIWEFRSLNWGRFLAVMFLSFLMAGCQSSSYASPVIVFLGDSLIARNDWTSFLNRSNVHNSGVGGNTVRDVINRLDAVYELKPDVVVLMVGINNKPNPQNIPQIIDDYRQLLIRLRSFHPELNLYVHSVLPVNFSIYGTSPSHVRIDNRDVQMLNRKLRALVAEFKGHFIDLHSYFLEDGELSPQYTQDGIHLNRAGYVLWRSHLPKHFFDTTQTDSIR